MRNSEGYGQKGGTGPTRGKRATVYEVVLPDGTTVQKRAMGLDQDVAVAMIYQQASGAWRVTAIRAEAHDWGNQQAVTARRVR